MPMFPLQDCQKSEIAVSNHDASQAIATCFANIIASEQKDFFASGLISLEEIQIVLPWRLSLKDVRNAVVTIIRFGVLRFSLQEWQEFIFDQHLRLQHVGAVKASKLMVENCS